jgi:endonuclease-3
MAQAFGHDAFPVDTHIHRLAQRWGLTSGASVEQTETDLKALLPPSSWKDAHLQVSVDGSCVQKPGPQCLSKTCTAICLWAACHCVRRPGADAVAVGLRCPFRPACDK